MCRNVLIFISLLFGNILYGQSVKPVKTMELSSRLQETSGLIYWNHLIWTHNDSEDKHVYVLDTNANLLDSIALNDIVNTDIEEISQDDSSVYLLDAGNNNGGIRTDLHILRITKESLLQRKPQIDTLWFSYQNQFDLSNESFNKTDFDCEAFIVTQDSIYLFTKQWLRQGTYMYVLPKQAGRHIAVLRDSLSDIGLITGVCYLPLQKKLVFCGYNRVLHPFLLVSYDFSEPYFFKGSLRKIKLRLPFHQIEAVTSEDGTVFYLTNEKINRPLLHIPPQLQVVDLSKSFF